MKKMIVIFSIIFSASLSYSQEYKPFKLPARAVKGLPGKYTLVSGPAFYHRKGIKGFLYIPRFRKGITPSSRPLLVYYHGTTRNRNAYRTVGNIIRYANQKKFTLLSVQNAWGTGYPQ